MAEQNPAPTRQPGDGSLDDGRLQPLLQGLKAVRDGDFSTRLPHVDDVLMDEMATVFNGMVDQLALFTSEVTRVAREVGTDGKLGGQAQVPGVSGTWKDLTDSVNAMAGNLTGQVRDIAEVATAVAQGDLTQKITVDVKGEMLELKNTINTMVDQLSSFADEVTRVAREVGSEGRLGGQAEVPGVAGTWRDLTTSVNFMAGNLTAQVRSIAQVATAVAQGDLTQKITVDARGEILELKNTINTMVDQLSSFADEVTRVAREVGTDGRLGGQADVKGVSGTWKSLTESVNVMADNLTAQVRSIADVTTAVAKGDLTQKIRGDARGEILELKDTINTMVDQLSSFADEVTRVARDVGTDGKLGGQATVRGVSGTWKDLTDNVNVMASNLTNQVRSIAQVSAAVAEGDLSKTINVDAKGEVAALAQTINTMVGTLSAFADEVTRVAREVGTDGILGGQAQVPGVSGTWKGLTDSVNSMAFNLTSQVRNIAQVTTAVARGDLSKKIDVDARGEILELKTTINTMVDQLSSFAAEVTRVAREVGSEGRLGGQAEVEGVSGTWKRLTENVNELAGNLTRQVRAIAEVTSAVATGDLTRSISVEAQGEVAELKDNINAMVQSLRESTRSNQEQDWLKTNLARVSGLMQGHRDLSAVAALIMNELTPLVGALHGTFFLADAGEHSSRLRMIASYGHDSGGSSAEFALGQSLVGQVALTRKPIVVDETPPDYVRISSSIGSAPPVNLIVLPIVFEDQVVGVIELASFSRFTAVQRDFLEQVMETIGINVNTIIANARTDALLAESQRLTSELQARSGELQAQQAELQRSNAELEEKAELLVRQNSDIELKNREIEQARQEIEERARQLALASKYKSEFLANMSHELRTPLNSLLILARLLAQNPAHNLTSKQVEFANVIHSAGTDLLQLINDILDLSTVEAGRMDIHPERFELQQLLEYVQTTFRPLTAEKGLEFEVTVAPGVPDELFTDDQRLRQVLRNLLSNAVKFTETGRVDLHVDMAGDMITFCVRDTGIGIAEENLHSIFGAFQQADGTTSRRYGGTGLGLSISREVAYLLGGEIRAESVFGEGSTFTLSLPVNHDVGADQSEPVPSEGVVAAFDAVSQPHRRLLVLEAGDDGLLTLLARSIGVELGDRQQPVGITVAGTPDDAIDALATNPHDCVVVDIGLPEAMALTFLKRVSERPELQSLPVFAHASRGLSPAQDRLLRALSRTHPVELLTTVDDVRDRILRQLSPDGVPADPLAGRRVLVIDDDVRNVFAITGVLELAGLKVLHAPNGRRGIELLLAEDSVDLVLMDVMMPEMDGYATTSAIRDMPQFADLPIIAVTAKAMQGDREKSLDSGATDYVTKPVDADELLSCMRRWLTG
ncbi:MAG TPA: HAMP domain-containing protein [Pseudonocardiaceae bacterium]|nr:HAMP domain-containing protein [Pseudonocardiaceae bacterium]